MNQNEPTVINAEEIINRATGGKKLPKFVVRMVKKLFHQDDFNSFFSTTTSLGYEFAEEFLKWLHAEVKVIGEENIPDRGRFTFAFNHPLGMLDAISSLAFLGRKYDGNIALPANDMMMIFKQEQEYFVPVNKLGGQARELGRLLDEAFQSARQMIIFPAGACARKINGVISELPWRKTFISKSRATQRDIIPVWFSGRNSKRFYRLHRFCEIFHIKFNFAMFTLADELFKCRGKKFKMVFGKPIPWQTFDDSRKDAEWGAWVREQSLALKQE